MYPMKQKSKRLTERKKKTNPFIAWGSPIILNKKRSDQKNILLLSVESLTDPIWLAKSLNIEINLPVFNALCNESTVFNNSVSQVDSTRPFAASVLYGLFP